MFGCNDNIPEFDSTSQKNDKKNLCIYSPDAIKINKSG